MPYANPNNPKRKAYLKSYRATHRVSFNKYRCKWRKKNWDKCLLQRREWSHRPNGILVSIRGRSKKRGIKFEIERQEFLEWYASQEEKCYYCGLTKDKQGKRYKSLSIDRKNNSLPYRIDNIVLCCMRCNTIKGSLFTAKEMKEIAEKYIKPKFDLN